MATPRHQGVTKNVLIVVPCLLAGGAAAFVTLYPERLSAWMSRSDPSGERSNELTRVEGGQGPLTVPLRLPPTPDGGAVVASGDAAILGREAEAASEDEWRERFGRAWPDPRTPRRMPPGSEERESVVKVWCEGLPLARCGWYPKDCEVAVYCDGTRFCRSQESYPSQETCAAEGILGASVACCPGLVARCGVPSGSGTCDRQEGSDAEPVCLRCGDGVCGPLEQACNCPEDCAPSEARPRVRHQGVWPEGAAARGVRAPKGTLLPGQCLDARKTPEDIQRCLVSWSEGLFARRRAAELQRVENLAPFTPFDVDLMACLERASSYDDRRSETSREGCIETLFRRTQDARLDKLRWYSFTYRGGE